MIKTEKCFFVVYLLFSLYDSLQSCKCTNPTGEVKCTVIENKKVSGCSKTLTNNLPIEPSVFLKSINTTYIEKYPIPYYTFDLTLSLVFKDTPSFLSWELRIDQQINVNEYMYKKSQYCGKLQIDSENYQYKNKEIEIKLSNGCFPNLQILPDPSAFAGSNAHHMLELILLHERDRVVSYKVLIPIEPRIIDKSHWSPSIAISNQPMENKSMYLVFSRVDSLFGIAIYDVTIYGNGVVLIDVKNTNDTLITFTNYHGGVCKAEISVVNCTPCLKSDTYFYCASIKKDHSWINVIVGVVSVAIVTISAFIMYKLINPRIISVSCEKPSVLLIMSYDCEKHEETVEHLASFLQCFCTIEFDRWKPPVMPLIHWITLKQKSCKYVIIVGSQGAWDKGINNVDRIELENHNSLRDPFKIILHLISDDFTKAIHNKENLHRFVGVNFGYSSSFGLPLPLKYKFLLPDNWKQLINHIFQLSPSTGKFLKASDNMEAMLRLDKLKQSIKLTEIFMEENPNWYTITCTQPIVKNISHYKEEAKIDTLSTSRLSENSEEVNNFYHLSIESLEEEYDNTYLPFPKSLSSSSIDSQYSMVEDMSLVAETDVKFV